MIIRGQQNRRTNDLTRRAESADPCRPLSGVFTPQHGQNNQEIRSIVTYVHLDTVFYKIAPRSWQPKRETLAVPIHSESLSSSETGGGPQGEIIFSSRLYRTRVVDSFMAVPKYVSMDA